MTPRRSKARNQAEKARRIADALEARGMLTPAAPPALDLDVEPVPLDPVAVADRLAELPDVGRLMAAELAGEPAEVPSESTWAAVVAVVADRIAARDEEAALRAALRQLEADLDAAVAERDTVAELHDDYVREHDGYDALVAELDEARALRRAAEVDLADARAELAAVYAHLRPDAPVVENAPPGEGDAALAGEADAAAVACQVPEHDHRLAHSLDCRVDPFPGPTVDALVASAAAGLDDLTGALVETAAAEALVAEDAPTRKSRAKPRRPVAGVASPAL